MRDSGWDQLPLDVRFAGKPAEMRAPPWITDCPHQLLTEMPSCEAEHMAAPTNTALVKKVLANSEPSTHGPFVWTGRALQAESDDLENHGAFVLLAISEILPERYRRRPS